MIAGAVALAVYAAVAVIAVRRLGPGKGAVVSCLAWLVVAGGLYPVVA